MHAYVYPVNTEYLKNVENLNPAGSIVTKAWPELVTLYPSFFSVFTWKKHYVPYPSPILPISSPCTASISTLIFALLPSTTFPASLLSLPAPSPSLRPYCSSPSPPSPPSPSPPPPSPPPSPSLLYLSHPLTHIHLPLFPPTSFYPFLFPPLIFPPFHPISQTSSILLPPSPPPPPTALYSCRILRWRLQTGCLWNWFAWTIVLSKVDFYCNDYTYSTYSYSLLKNSKFSYGRSWDTGYTDSDQPGVYKTFFDRINFPVNRLQLRKTKTGNFSDNSRLMFKLQVS